MPPMAAAKNPSSVVASVTSSDCDSSAESCTSVAKIALGAGNT